MGNSQSQQADARSVYKAVADNDYVTLDKLIIALRATGQLTPQELGFVDKEGRTPLLIAANKNYHQCARKLLESGADVGYLNPSQEVRGGTALHEATRNGHEAMAELLLSYGASPFQCNALGKTCMDEAVLAGAGNLLRRFEHLAPWTGHLLVKTSVLAGMSQTYKSRYLVAIPLLPAPPAAGSNPTGGQAAEQQQQQQQLIRRQLWIYKDTASLVPKCRVWLDGATVVRTGTTDAILRLHSSHKPPQGDVYNRYDRGYCIYLRARDSSAAAASVVDTFMNAVNVPVVSSSASEPNLAGPYQHPPQLPPAAVSPHSSLPALPMYPTPSQLPELPSRPSSAATTPAAGLTPYASSGGGSGTAAPAATTAGSPPVFGLRTNTPIVSTQVDTLNALPGETDQEFAQRLASMITATTGQEQPSLHSSPPISTRPSLTHPAATPGPTPAPASAPSSHSVYPAVPIWGAEPAPPLHEQPSAPPLLPQHPQHPPAVPPVVPAVAGAPPAAAPAAATADDALCVICLANPREAGYLHGATLHRCVCRGCCGEIKQGEPCPLCRLPVERVVGVF